MPEIAYHTYGEFADEMSAGSLTLHAEMPVDVERCGFLHLVFGDVFQGESPAGTIPPPRDTIGTCQLSRRDFLYLVEHGIETILDTEERQPEAFSNADRRRLQQVLGHLKKIAPGNVIDGDDPRLIRDSQ